MIEELGLERISNEYRNQIWQSAGDDWEQYRSLIINPESGGASSNGEAQRLYWAEQIRYGQKLDLNLNHNQIAELLLEQIQGVFQHNLKPISTESNEEEKLFVILQYYFPEEEVLDRFLQLAEGGQPEITAAPIHATPPEPVVSQVESAPPPAAAEVRKGILDKISTPIEHEEEEHLTGRDVDVPETLYPEAISATDSQERPKIREYIKLNSINREQHSFSIKVKEILDRHYPADTENDN